jgi:hypothetical protein
VVEVCNVLIANGRKVHLISGVHGDEHGNLIDEENFFRQDRDELAHHKDNIHMVSMTKHQQVIIPLDKSKEVVLGLCYGRQVFEKYVASCATRGVKAKYNQYKMLMD